MADFDKKYAVRDKYGNITAKNQDGIDAKAAPRKSDNKLWRFGDSLSGVKPNKIR